MLDRGSFLDKVFNNYKYDVENRKELYNSYYEALTDTKMYDWDEVFKELFRTYRYRTLPTPAYLIACLKMHEIKRHEVTTAPIVRNIVGLKNGLEYEFGFLASETDYFTEAAKLESRGFVVLTDSDGKRKVRA